MGHHVVFPGVIPGVLDTGVTPPGPLVVCHQWDATDAALGEFVNWPPAQGTLSLTNSTTSVDKASKVVGSPIGGKDAVLCDDDFVYDLTGTLGAVMEADMTIGFRVLFTADPLFTREWFGFEDSLNPLLLSFKGNVVGVGDIEAQYREGAGLSILDTLPTHPITYGTVATVVFKHRVSDRRIFGSVDGVTFWDTNIATIPAHTGFDRFWITSLSSPTYFGRIAIACEFLEGQKLLDFETLLGAY